MFCHPVPTKVVRSIPHGDLSLWQCTSAKMEQVTDTEQPMKEAAHTVASRQRSVLHVTIQDSGRAVGEGQKAIEDDDGVGVE